ncbi:MAG: M36 family metallopeptidase [bacterium]
MSRGEHLHLAKAARASITRLAVLALFAPIVLTTARGIARAAGASYEVFARPSEYPDDGPRTVETDPALAGGAASPFGWHDTDGAAGAEYTTTRGNNVFAYTDADADNIPDAGSAPDGGAALEFLFPLDLGAEPAAYRPAAVTNAFYWCNILHDVLYEHGFDEAAGNFQENNYGRGGVAGDAVLVEVQEGAFTNGVTVSTPIDGVAPRLQLALFTLTTPRRDSALESYVVAYAYTRAVTSRLVGGPLDSSCLSAQEALGMSVGWSDWVALVVTAHVSDAATTSRGVGTYVMGQPPAGAGIRAARYSTDPSLNALTYASIATLPPPFGTGTVWATALWEMYWALVEKHGFNANIYADWTSGGNTLALRLVLDGMKTVECNPGFVEGRDAILSADQNLTGGANQCEIWRAFAARGLGLGASQGSSSSLADGIEAFDVPAPCVITDVAGSDAPGGAGTSASLAIAAPEPNPFATETRIRFAIPRAGRVRLAAYDAQGRVVAGLIDEARPAGASAFAWRARAADGSRVHPGVYFLRLEAGGDVATRKLVVVR